MLSRELTAGATGLGDFFGRQDGAVQRNYEAAKTEFDLIERGTIIGWACTLALNADPVLSQRRAKAPNDATAETIFINLLHAAWSGLVNATRLALYGAHIDALNLTRWAFEATYHAEYFRQHPADALEWDKTGHILDLDDFHAAIEAFRRAKGIRADLDKRYAGLGGVSLTRLHRELSSYGTHPNPKTVGLRLASPVRGRARLGYMSVGYAQATRLTASHILHIVGYLLSEYFDGCGPLLAARPEIFAAYKAFQDDRDVWRSSATPQGLSLND